MLSTTYREWMRACVRARQVRQTTTLNKSALTFVRRVREIPGRRGGQQQQHKNSFGQDVPCKVHRPATVSFNPTSLQCRETIRKNSLPAMNASLAGFMVKIVVSQRRISVYYLLLHLFYVLKYNF